MPCLMIETFLLRIDWEIVNFLKFLFLTLRPKCSPSVASP